jgi:hypothetical protein
VTATAHALHGSPTSESSPVGVRGHVGLAPGSVIHGGAYVKLVGIALIVVGLVGFVFGGISWTRNETVVDAGPIEIEAEQQESVPLTPIASGLALVSGLVLVVAGGRRP